MHYLILFPGRGEYLKCNDEQQVHNILTAAVKEHNFLTMLELNGYMEVYPLDGGSKFDLNHFDW